MGKISLVDKDQNLKSESNNLELIDKVIGILTRVRSNLGVASFLMDGEGHALESPFSDFEFWFSDIMNRLDQAIQEVTKIRTV